jgi:hypothetical protein
MGGSGRLTALNSGYKKTGLMPVFYKGLEI